MSSFSVRICEPRDRVLFTPLWKALYEEVREMGAPMIPDTPTISVGLRRFDSYVAGSLFGVAVLAEEPEHNTPIGCFLAGEDWEGYPGTTDFGKVAGAWGLYVAPAWRKHGVARCMHELGQGALRDMGFETILAWTIDNNTVARQLLEAGGMQPFEVGYRKSLKEPSNG